MNTENIFDTGEVLPIVEEFYSIQGEGFQTGKPAYFIRVGGCDIGCKWCDSKPSWDAAVHHVATVAEIVQKVLQTAAKAVVITGGEPAIYNLTPLTKALKESGIQTFIETSGAYEITGQWDWVCLSPKTNKSPVASSYAKANELKIIIYKWETDIEWAEKQSQKVGADCLLYLQSEWSVFKKNSPKIVAYIKEHPQWNLSIQMHKFVGIP